jgi:hypothetical protein
MYYSPLEQFDIYVIKLCVFSEIYSLTNFTLFLVLIYNLFFFIFTYFLLNNKTNTIKIFYFYNIFYLFICNLIGTIPYIFILIFALLMSFMATYLGLIKHKMKFFSFFFFFFVWESKETPNKHSLIGKYILKLFIVGALLVIIAITCVTLTKHCIFHLVKILFLLYLYSSLRNLYVSMLNFPLLAISYIGQIFFVLYFLSELLQFLQRFG